MSATTTPLPAILGARLWGLLAGVVVAVIILMLPEFPGLSIAGQRMLAVLAFAVIVWMSEAMDYAVSSVVIVALMAFLLGTAPNPKNPAVMLGTGGGLQMALAGFSNSALALVAARLLMPNLLPNCSAIA